MLRLLDSPTSDELYKRLVSQYQEDDELVLNSKEKSILADNKISISKHGDFVESMLMQDLSTYLPDDILTKVDRAAMAVGLETRVPFLDHELVEFALQIPKTTKIRCGRGKWPLRQILYKYVPQTLIDRPKQGFSLPLDDWLRGPLREWAEELLEERVLKEQGFLNVFLVRKKWQEHLSGKRNWQYLLWNILMWQAWLAEATSDYE
jgi:asparagine synthase (glutamine-hydrolysing)